MTRALGRMGDKLYVPTRRAVVVATTVAIGLTAATAAFAGSAGDLDRSFGQHGLVVVRNIDRSAEDAAVGGHNRIVAVAGRGAFRSHAGFRTATSRRVSATAAWSRSASVR